MQKSSRGYFSATVDDLPVPARYFYMPDGESDYPDPASQFQPEGVHGPSEVVYHQSYLWADQDWRGLPMEELILYELHVGTFTPEGTFDAVIARLPELKETGINALALLPVSQFPGERNWGYDAVYPYAVQNSYGGPDGLKQLVNAAHKMGLAVILDVIYNHLGPEGNYLHLFGPYFNDHYRTPWGKALNFDNDYSDGVRAYFSGNVIYWARYFHIDGLRFDAIHEIYDRGAVSFWELTAEKLGRLTPTLGRPFYLIAESDLNSPRVIQPVSAGGMGFDAQWLDDFHHALYVLLDKNGKERYADFGTIRQLRKAYEAGFVHSGEYVTFRHRMHGASSAGIPGNRFIIFNQNHDQIGNRAGAERLSQLVDFERLKLAAGALLLAPYIPMLFMGEEYGEDTPFFYFVSHSDPELITAVAEGRKELFSNFNQQQQAPDPQDPQTFLRSRLDWKKRDEGKYLIMRKWTTELLYLRRTLPALRNYRKDHVWADVVAEKGLALYREDGEGLHRLLILLNFGEESLSFRLPSDNRWNLLLDSRENKWTPGGKSDHPVLPPAAQPENELLIPPLTLLLFEGGALETTPGPPEAVSLI